VSRFPFGDDSKKSKKNEGNGKDEEQIQGSFTAFRVTTKNAGGWIGTIRAALVVYECW
jgi:hypothetical protein